MSGDIFFQRGDGDLVPMSEAPYDSEDVLQELLARFPDELAGDLEGTGEPRRWLLVGRESALPDQDDGAGRWSVDHLFLDQDSVPTLVEVKRSSDTRIRREVVGQLIDYAANAVAYWSIETLRSTLEDRLKREGRDAETELSTFLGADGDPDAYWEQAGANLKAGRIRLVFVADKIPRELRRVVEFLNEQMDAEVIAIEVRQYVGPKDERTLVPRLIGQTAAAETRKGTAGKRQWDETSFLEELRTNRGEEEERIARALIDWARVQLPRFLWGTGRFTGSFIPELDHAGINYFPFVLWTNGRAEIQFGRLITRPPFDDQDVRREFLRRLNEIPGVSIPEDKLALFPSIQLGVLADRPEAFEGFRKALDWFCETVRGTG